MVKKIFVTGTDTDAGKTFCSCALTYALRDKGLSVRPYKPIVSGLINGENADLKSHIKASGLNLKQHEIATYIYEEPIAPHIGALKKQENIDFEKLNQDYDKALAENKDVLLIDGAGGFYLPIDNLHTLPEWGRLKECEVILVVGMKLGCLNHALLTVKAIKEEGYKFKGFFTHSVTKEKMPYYDENLRSIKSLIGEEYFLGDIPFIEECEPKLASNAILIDKILN